MNTESHTYEQLKLSNQLCFPLYAASRRIVGAYTPYLKPLGITYTQYLVFMVLWEEDGESVTEIGRKLFLDTGTLTPMLKKMEQKGFVIRKRCSSDERVVTVYLTDAGRAMREKCADIPGSLACQLSLSREEAGELYSLLYKILAEPENS